MSELRDAYKKWSDRLNEILEEPTAKDLVGLLPAFHNLKKPNGQPATVSDYRDFVIKAYKSKQKHEIIGLLMEASAELEDFKLLHDEFSAKYIDIVVRHQK